MTKSALLLTSALFTLFATSGAQAAVTVIGGGMAQACSEAALGGETDPKFVKLCTDALETEFLNATDRAGTFVNRGVMRLRQAAYPEATRDFNAALKIKPELGEAYVNRGAASIGRKDYEGSLPDINRGLELGVDEPAKAYYNRALAYEGMDDTRSAYFDYRKAQELAPEWEAPAKELTRFKVDRR